MTVISDAYMAERLSHVRTFPAVFLRKGPAYQPPDARDAAQAAIVREHGRRNMQLQAEGRLAIVGPIAGGGDIVGLCVFNAAPEEAREIIAGDGAVRAGIFVYDLVTLYGFPGDSLPPA